MLTWKRLVVNLLLLSSFCNTSRVRHEAPLIAENQRVALISHDLRLEGKLPRSEFYDNLDKLGTRSLGARIVIAFN